MSTRSAIGYKRFDGSIRAVYCHFDGYPSAVGKTLIQNYDLLGLDDLLDLGDMSSLASTLEFSVFYGRDRGEDNTQAREFVSVDDFKDCYSDSDYFYLFIDDNWYVSNGNKFISLEDNLRSLGVDFTKFNPDRCESRVPNLRDYLIDLVNEGEVEPMTMIKSLIDHMDIESVEAVVNELTGEIND